MYSILIASTCDALQTEWQCDAYAKKPNGELVIYRDGDTVITLEANEYSGGLIFIDNSDKQQIQ